MPLTRFSFGLGLLMRISSVLCILLLSLAHPSSCRSHSSDTSDALSVQTGAAPLAPRATGDSLTASATLDWLNSIPRAEARVPSTLERRRKGKPPPTKQPPPPTHTPPPPPPKTTSTPPKVSTTAPAPSTSKPAPPTTTTSSTSAQATAGPASSTTTSSTSAQTTAGPTSSAAISSTSAQSTAGTTSSTTAPLTSTTSTPPTGTATTTDNAHRTTTTATSPHRTPCALKSCTGSTCSRSAPPPSPAHALTKRAMKGPEDYNGNVPLFFLSQLHDFRPNLLSYHLRALPAATLLPFANADLTTGITGLFGCTSVLVISQRAVWISHFWEDPYFLRRSSFPIALRSLRNGGPPARNVGGSIDGGMPGLGPLVNPGGPFHADARPRVLVVSVASEVDPGEFHFAPEIERMKRELRTLLPGAPVEGFPYVAEDGEAMREDAVNGKVLVQYDAAMEDRSKPRHYRVWVEATRLPSFDQTWRVD